MIREFRHFEIAEVDGMDGLIDGMYELLEALDEGIVPNRGDYTLDDLKTYLASLVAGQRGPLMHMAAGSWAVVPDDEGMDPGARAAYISRPTQLASATLARALCEFPLTALGIPGYREALHAGFVSCATHGIDIGSYGSDAVAIDALRILALGKVPWLLHRSPDFSPVLKSVLDHVAADMARRLASCTADGLWGEDYCEGFRCAVETLRLRNDPEFMSSLEQARRDSASVSREELPW